MKFKTKAALARALLDGRTFKTPTGGVLYYDEDEEDTPFLCKKSGGWVVKISSYWDVGTELSEILPWNQRIPNKGVLCWVWDNCKVDKTLHIVTSFNGSTSDDWPYKVRGDKFKNALPLNKDELSPFIVEV